MKTSWRGLNLIKNHEGLKLQSYLCPANVWTIGYGHTKGVKKGDEITREDAERLLLEDLQIFESQVLSSVGESLNQNQFDAVVSFVYNLGIGNFETSTLRKKIIADPIDPAIAQEFKRWVYSNGEKLKGLERRRAEEANLYFLRI